MIIKGNCLKQLPLSYIMMKTVSASLLEDNFDLVCAPDEYKKEWEINIMEFMEGLSDEISDEFYNFS